MRVWRDDMNDMVAIIILLVFAVLLLIGFLAYLSFIRKQKNKYEEELLREVRGKVGEAPQTIQKEKKIPTTEVYERRREQVDLAAMLEKMQKDLEGQNKEESVDFEQEQEETSIISYQELKKAVESFTEEEELAQEKSPISVQEVLSLKEAHDEEIKKREDPILSMLQEKTSPKTVQDEASEEHKKFQNTEFISPVYGRQDQKNDYPHVPLVQEQEEVLSVLDTEENTHNEQFLNELKDFRNQL